MNGEPAVDGTVKVGTILKALRRHKGKAFVQVDGGTGSKRLALIARGPKD